jgi:hypothetical protein
MASTTFDRDALARWYARQHLETDPAIRAVYYLPENSPEREIRLLEVNELIAERADDSPEPVDFGIDTGLETQHTLLVLDVTPGQWDRIRASSFDLPEGWTLAGALIIGNDQGGQ